MGVYKVMFSSFERKTCFYSTYIISFDLINLNTFRLNLLLQNYFIGFWWINHLPVQSRDSVKGFILFFDRCSHDLFGYWWVKELKKPKKIQSIESISDTFLQIIVEIIICDILQWRFIIICFITDCVQSTKWIFVTLWIT